MILNLVKTSHITCTKIKARHHILHNWLNQFYFIHTFFLSSYNIFWLSNISTFQFLACEGVERPEEGRQSLERKKAEAGKRCLKYVKEINNPTERRELL